MAHSESSLVVSSLVIAVVGCSSSTQGRVDGGDSGANGVDSGPTHDAAPDAASVDDAGSTSDAGEGLGLAS